MRKLVKIRKLILLSPKYLHLDISAHNFGKQINVRFEIITFEIGYLRIFFKITLILFGPKRPKLDICAQNFGKQMSDFEIITCKISLFCEILLRLES